MVGLFLQWSSGEPKSNRIFFWHATLRKKEILTNKFSALVSMTEPQTCEDLVGINEHKMDNPFSEDGDESFGEANDLDDNFDEDENANSFLSQACSFQEVERHISQEVTCF